jgi:Fe-S cluster biogenesis protein NfuA
MQGVAQSFEDRVRDALRRMLPAMVTDGGGAEIVSVRDRSVTLRLIGSCLFCPSRAMSAAALERGLRALVPDLDAVRIAYPPPAVPVVSRESSLGRADVICS